ncbi:nitrate ABC transporter permease [Subtercola boreus]|uniref:Nitrate ABC transporter permease n=1 Tax=Subtercola boreus TaxID=120213 RepID=A0A3E0VG98_9MICO|nr:ABC transporter permease subunit [Subtercola boreus]RFA08665.1 nitrate ABC transporter permease [Subtercola boreus]TQL54388.1 NitT/TauT family transport system permease protein [Subtercola boreus]
MTDTVAAAAIATAPSAAAANSGGGANPGRGAARRSVARSVLPPVVLGVVFLLLWQLAVVAFDIKPYLLPSPTDIAGQIFIVFPLLWSSLLATGLNALIGLVLGAILAVVLALLASRVTIFDRMIVPIVAAVAVVPIVALAPILNTMFGSTSDTPRRIVVLIVVFAPIFINTLRGLRQVRPVHRDLMRAYAASNWQLTRTVTLPGAVPFIFTGLRIAAPLGVISAIVAEYFGGLQNGLGSRITSAAANSAYPRAWAYVFGAIILGLVFYGVTLLLERLASRRRA